MSEIDDLCSILSGCGVDFWRCGETVRWSDSNAMYKASPHLPGKITLKIFGIAPEYVISLYNVHNRLADSERTNHEEEE